MDNRGSALGLSWGWNNSGRSEGPHPAPLGERGTVPFVWGSEGGLGGRGGGNGWMERQVPRLAASLSCFSLPTPSSAVSRGRRKVISDLTPKSQLLVPAPRSGESAAPSQSSGGFNPFASWRAGAGGSRACDPGPGAARLLRAAPWIPPGDYKRARLQGAARLGQGPASPERSQGPRGRARVSGTKRDVWIVLTTQTDALQHVCIYGIHMLSWQMKGQ